MTVVRQQQKLDAIEYKGGKCEHCGYTGCPAVFEFHHVDPSQKDFQIGQTYRSFDNLKTELENRA